MRKKGELTSKQIITIIIIIVSFVVLLIFYFSLNLKGEINKENCKNSIAMKHVYGKLGVSAINLGNLISLKCAAEKVCITTGARCPNAGKNVENIKVSKNNLKENVMKAIAEKQVDSWDMVFAGEKDFPESKNLIIFYVIYFDDEIQKEIKLIYPGEYYYDMLKKLKINDKSYFLYFYGQEQYAKTMGTDIYDDIFNLQKPLAIVVGHTKSEEEGYKIYPYIFEYSAETLKRIKEKGYKVYVNFV